VPMLFDSIVLMPLVPEAVTMVNHIKVHREKQI
jgi:hypothetical protein